MPASSTYSDVSTADSIEPSIPASSSSPPSTSSLINKSGGDLSVVDLICADMDGTLLSPDHNIPDITFNRINKADNNGCNNNKTIIPTIPCISYSRPGIYLNGAITYDHTGAVVAEKIHSYTDIVEAVRVVEGVDDVVVLLYNGDRVLAPCSSGRIEEIYESLHTPCPENCGSYEKMLSKIHDEAIPINLIHFMSLEGRLPEDMLRKIRTFSESSGCTAAQSLWRSCDVVPAGVNKGLGVRVLKENQGYERVACIGDALNDLEMLQEADVPVAMGNALPEIKKIASLEVNPNSNSELPGVADLVDRILSS
ncbi:hypothetical protein FOZ61_005811 [Perkinsus olseni]|uniref:Uncharacterized protein n=1 Tax=Perkinsus olseni TaxID=32597 RepID=A0A7J6LFX6_PEROL|nr:hypothetical protein FOZ61_005811 [Perkinsus olseni]